MTKVLFVGNNPGGVRSFLPILQKKKGSTIVIPPNSANLLKNSDAKVTSLPEDWNEDWVDAVLKKEAPELVLTGTSLPQTKDGLLEGVFRQRAKKMGIQTLSVIDHWCNYSLRFTNKAPQDSLPGLICLMDEKAKQDMVNEGFDPMILRITGQPAFDSLFQGNREARRKKIRESLNIPLNQKLIGFVSEPVSKDFGRMRGYDEKQVFSSLKELLKEIYFPGKLLLKIHPRDQASNYPGAEVFSGEPIDFAATCDVLVGMTSILLVEASILGTPSLSFQPGAHPENPWFQLISPLPVVTQKKELQEKLSRIFSGEALQGFSYQERNASNNVLKVMEELTSSFCPR